MCRVDFELYISIVYRQMLLQGLTNVLTYLLTHSLAYTIHRNTYTPSCGSSRCCGSRSAFHTLLLFTASLFSLPEMEFLNRTGRVGSSAHFRWNHRLTMTKVGVAEVSSGSGLRPHYHNTRPRLLRLKFFSRFGRRHCGDIRYSHAHANGISSLQRRFFSARIITNPHESLLPSYQWNGWPEKL